MESLAKDLEAFGKLAVGIQWVLLGLVAIGFGAYLLNMGVSRLLGRLA